MNLIEQLESDVVQSLKDKDELAVLTLRQIKTALGNALIANGRQPLTDEAIQKVLRTEVKRRREAIELYRQGGRNELADKEAKEIAIVSRYLPPELSSETIQAAVAAAISELGATGPQDTGKVMGVAMAKLNGQADGSAVSAIAKQLLSEKK